MTPTSREMRFLDGTEIDPLQVKGLEGPWVDEGSFLTDPAVRDFRLGYDLLMRKAETIKFSYSVCSLLGDECVDEVLTTITACRPDPEDLLDIRAHALVELTQRATAVLIDEISTLKDLMSSLATEVSTAYEEANDD